MLKGKIVLVPFPFDDLSVQKLRPAVCLTNEIGEHDHVILAFITSQIPQPLLKSDFVINSTEKHFLRTGLKVTSTIRLHRVMTITTGIIRRELGELPKNLQKTVNDKLRELFVL